MDHRDSFGRILFGAHGTPASSEVIAPGWNARDTL
jgi:hypothetical protein